MEKNYLCSGCRADDLPQRVKIHRADETMCRGGGEQDIAGARAETSKSRSHTHTRVDGLYNTNPKFNGRIDEYGIYRNALTRNEEGLVYIA